MSSIHVLAADVGGTTTRVMLAAADPRHVTCLEEHHYPSAEHTHLLPILRHFLGTVKHKPLRACFAIAGPITGSIHHQQAQVTNLPWSLDSVQLSTDLGIEHVTLINDFAAVAHALPALDEADWVSLQVGNHQDAAPRAILGAGTGLGQAMVIPMGEDYRVIATEGGHVDFASQSEEQWALFLALQKQFTHVSYERLLSGAGLEFIYRFLHDRQASSAPDLLGELKPQDDPAAAVSHAALSESDPVAVRALELFIEIYGAQAGNLALNCLPHGGLYIAGGIAPRMRSKFEDGRFLRAFNAKGRMATVTAGIPVRLITHPRPGLLGAARHAARSQHPETSNA